MRKVKDLEIRYRAGFTDYSKNGGKYYGIQIQKYPTAEISRGPIGIDIVALGKNIFYPWASIISMDWHDVD